MIEMGSSFQRDFWYRTKMKKDTLSQVTEPKVCITNETDVQYQKIPNTEMQIQKAVNKKPKPKGTKIEGAGGVESKTKLQKLNKVKTKEV